MKQVFKKNQIIIFVIAFMLVAAGYLNFSNQNSNLLPTSSLADSEQMASIGDATLVSANQAVTNQVATNQTDTNQVINNVETNTVEDNSAVSSNIINETQTSTKVENNKTKQDSYFTQSKIDRDAMYSQILENYQKILETDGLGEEEKKNAQDEIKRINNEKNAIMIAENLIRTKGFNDIVLFVNNGNVTGVVQAETLDDKQIAQIQNIITRELDVKASKINISNK